MLQLPFLPKVPPNTQRNLWRYAATFLCFGYLIADTSAEPTTQTVDQMETTLVKIRQAEPTGDDYFPDDPKYSRQRRMIRQLPPESVPVLIRDAQTATKAEDEAFYEYLLRLKINHYGMEVPENLRQAGIDFLMSRYAQTDNTKLRKHLLDQFQWIDDPQVEAFVGRLSASANPTERSAALDLNEKRPNLLAEMRRKPMPQTHEQIVDSIDHALHPDKVYHGYSGELAEESIPMRVSIVTQGLQVAQDEQERWRYMQLLHSDLDRYDDILSVATRRDAINAMINECERMNNAGVQGQMTITQGAALQRRLRMIESFDDPEIIQFFDRMKASPNEYARAVAKSFSSDIKN